MKHGETLSRLDSVSVGHFPGPINIHKLWTRCKQANALCSYLTAKPSAFEVSTERLSNLRMITQVHSMLSILPCSFINGVVNSNFSVSTVSTTFVDTYSSVFHPVNIACLDESSAHPYWVQSGYLQAGLNSKPLRIPTGLWISHLGRNSSCVLCTVGLIQSNLKASSTAPGAFRNSTVPIWTFVRQRSSWLSPQASSMQQVSSALNLHMSNILLIRHFLTSAQLAQVGDQ
jgi:hypothetical protein